MKEVNPQDTSRAAAFASFVHAPMPMVTLFKTIDVSRLVRLSKRRGLKFNMLMCYCAGLAAARVPEFRLLPVGDRLFEYDSLGINVIVANAKGGINACDVPFSPDLNRFNADYLELTSRVRESCSDFSLDDAMILGTSSLVECELDGVVNQYSGIFNNPFLIWCKYKRRWWRYSLRLSFQFHHVQMDGGHACCFLDELQKSIDALSV